MKTNEVEVVAHDVLIFGTGLAGLRAAVEIARASKDSINMALVSKVQIQRPHSVCAEGGLGSGPPAGGRGQSGPGTCGIRSRAQTFWPTRMLFTGLSK